MSRARRSHLGLERCVNRDRWSPLALCADLSNEPYNFSYAHYARANPIAS